jgi:arrestin-related trafficking adapter 9
MSLPDRDIPPSKPSKSRWDWARLKELKPFAKSVRHITEFYIQPDDPHRQYCPGDVVTGNVVLKVIKPVDITHIVICLHGFAQVYKRPNEPGEGYRNYNAALIAGKTNKAGGYYGNGFVSLFEDEIVLCGDGRLDEGTYQFGFELHFPQTHLPGGIDVSLPSRRIWRLCLGFLTYLCSSSAELSRI